MKKTELEKSKGLKIRGQMQHAGIPSRFAAGSALPDRREQRKLDQAAGLVPFAVKLPEALTGQLRERAAQEGLGLNELTARLLQAGLAAAGPTAAPVAPAVVPKAAEKAPAKKAAVKSALVKEAATTAPAKKAAAEPAAPAKKAAAKKAAAKKATSQAIKAAR